MAEDEINHLKQLACQYQRNLHILEIQSAQFGLDVPLRLANEINSQKGSLEQLRKQLEAKQRDTIPDNAIYTGMNDHPAHTCRLGQSRFFSLI